MILGGDDLEVALYCVHDVVIRRQKAGQPIPAWLLTHKRRLDHEYEASMSPARHQFDCDPPELDVDSRIGVAEAAKILGLSERHVQRLWNDLDGEKVSGCYVFRESVVTEFAEARRHRSGAANQEEMIQ